MQWGNKKRHLGFFDQREWSGDSCSYGITGAPVFSCALGTQLLKPSDFQEISGDKKTRDKLVEVTKTKLLRISSGVEACTHRCNTQHPDFSRILYMARERELAIFVKSRSTIKLKSGNAEPYER